MVVDLDAAALADLEAGGDGEVVGRAHADAGNDEVGGDGAGVGKLEESVRWNWCRRR